MRERMGEKVVMPGGNNLGNWNISQRAESVSLEMYKSSLKSLDSVPF